MPARVSTGDRDAVLRQIRWCAAVQTPVSCHCKLDENAVRNVKPMQLVMQYLTKAAIKLPSAVNRKIRPFPNLGIAGPLLIHTDHTKTVTMSRIIALCECDAGR